MIRGKVVRIPGGIVVRWPDEPESDVERAAVRRQHQLETLARARAAARTWGGRSSGGRS